MPVSWVDRLTNWNVGSLFSRKASPNIKRSVFVNEPLPIDQLDVKGRVQKRYIYNTNQVLTSKYTIVTFIPRNLLEQFRRFANVLFLVIDILQLFPRFHTESAGLVIFPLLIVLAATALKDGYEDIKRHQADRRVNHSISLILSGGGWRNPNQTKGKSKTFVRGVLKRKKQPLKSYQSPLDDVNVDYYFAEEHQGSTRSLLRPTAYWQQTLWEDVRVGDFIKVQCDESIPADILICATSHDDNEAFVETKNLDGETNLKSRRAVDELQHLRSPEACATSPGFRVDVDAPDVNMFRFDGAVVMKSGEIYATNIQTTLLRGTVLRNTEWVIGIVLYTGQDTKVILNAGDTPSKRSRVEIQMNTQVLVNLILLLVMCIVCAIAESIIEREKFPEGAPWLFEDNQSGDNPNVNGLITWANGLINFEDVIPISLYISLEFVRTCQAAFIYADPEITYEKTNQATLARSWNLSDDLGQIEYIFSDKTGTLTQNMMVFRTCTVAGTLYQETNEIVPTSNEHVRVKNSDLEPHGSSTNLGFASDASPSSAGPATADPPSSERVKLAELIRSLRSYTEANYTNDPFFNESVTFFTVLSLCHTALVAKDPNNVNQQIKYNAQSPDEAALVQAAADVGFIFLGREREIMRIRTPYSEDILRFELLNILEFSSARRRMSVILRKVDDPERNVYVLAKGADNVIYSRLREDESEEMKSTTQQHLDQFASKGLRTLCLAYKVLSESEYEDWVRKYDEASVALENREEKVELISSEMETGFTLLGGTAIEDKLQDGVPETIMDLKRAGIKLWLLTGDKLETAIAVGHSANLVAPESTLIVIRGGNGGAISVERQLLDAVYQFFSDSIVEGVPGLEPRPSITPRGSEKHLKATLHSRSQDSDVTAPKPNLVLVLDGAALNYALETPLTKTILLRIGIRCSAVICCGVSPLQKALVVRLVKEGLHTMTLAIGDGANDVSMIQTAHVGVGIRGEEGLQAVNSADYAIAQFRFLKRLLFVHGHWAYERNGSLIVNFFYKNVVYVGVLWWFQIYCGWSTQNVIDSNYIFFWNIAFTSLPVIAIGVFDRFIDAHILVAVPELYRYGREQRWFGLRTFTVYMLDGILQSAVVFFLITYAYFGTSVRKDGYDSGYIYESSAAMAIATVMIANMYNGLSTWAWTIWVWFAVLFGIVFVWIYTVVYSASSSATVYGNNYFLFKSSIFWFGLTFAIIISLLPRYLYKAIQQIWYPTDFDILKECQRLNPNMDFSSHPVLNAAAFAVGALDGGGAATDNLNAVPMQDLGEIIRLPYNFHNQSMTDMSLGGEQVINRGFGFAAEEGGIHLSQVQSNLSDRRKSTAKKPLSSGFKRTFQKMRNITSKSH